MIRIKYRLLCIGTVIGIAVSSSLLTAASPAASTTLPSASEREYQFLKGQQESFSTFVQQERVELREQQRDVISEINILLTTLKWVLSIFSALFVGILTFFHFKSRKDVQEIVERRFHHDIADEVQKNGAQLKIQIEREIHSLGRKIIVIAPEADVQKFRELEFPAMQKRGFTNVSFQTDAAKITPDSCDLLIYWYQSLTDQVDDGLKDMIEHLKTFGSSVPLIVYTFRKARSLNASDRTLLETHPMHYIANMPLSLISNVFSIINALYPPQA